jgi:NitT/TauT family transport system substrate-binding protein
MLVINTETLNDNPKLGKALSGAWFEVMALMKKGDEKALNFMAQASGTDLAGYKSQLDSTMMFYEASEAVKFANSDALASTMKKVSEFSFEHGILGEGAPNAEFIGMEFPGGKSFGDKSNIKLRFVDTYVKMAAEGKL